MPTNIRDVAKKAGVAPITVSRVINNSGYVSQKTRARVEAVIEELGYVPNMLGPSLRFKQTMTLALVVTDITNPFWTTIARGVEDEAQANGYSTILCNTDESVEKQAQYLDMLLRRRIDGMLLAPVRSAPEPVRLIQKQGIPVVVLDRLVPDVQVDTVRTDNKAGAYNLTRHLLDLGHRRIAMLAGPHGVSTSVDRVAGYRQALTDAGLPESAFFILWGEFTRESGYELTRRLLQSAGTLPTALFAANNLVAIGVLEALREANIPVPDQMALVTIDDLQPASLISPPLTVVNQPAQEMGQRAAQLLLERIAGKVEDDCCRQILLPTEMVIRASSGGKIT
jgi:LacI family transcriptional regulator